MKIGLSKRGKLGIFFVHFVSDLSDCVIPISRDLDVSRSVMQTFVQPGLHGHTAMAFTNITNLH